jgi:hypothetical protein
VSRALTDTSTRFREVQWSPSTMCRVLRESQLPQPLQEYLGATSRGRGQLAGLLNGPLGIELAGFKCATYQRSFDSLRLQVIKQGT